MTADRGPSTKTLSVKSRYNTVSYGTYTSLSSIYPHRTCHLLHPTSHSVSTVVLCLPQGIVEKTIDMLVGDTKSLSVSTVGPRLPQEIFVEIIDMLARDRETLLSCSLVSRKWVNRSRHHIFAKTRLLLSFDLQLRSKVGLEKFRHHVRSLEIFVDYSGSDNRGGFTEVQNGLVLTPFHNLQSLNLFAVSLTMFDEGLFTRIYSKQLTSLTVERLTASPSALRFLVCRFPRLDNLSLVDLERSSQSNDPIPSDFAITPSFQGKLRLSNIEHSGASLVAEFLNGQLPMAFEDVEVDQCELEKKSLRDLFAACKGTVKRLKTSGIRLRARGKFHLRGFVLLMLMRLYVPGLSSQTMTSTRHS